MEADQKTSKIPFARVQIEACSLAQEKTGGMSIARITCCKDPGRQQQA